MSRRFAISARFVLIALIVAPSIAEGQGSGSAATRESSARTPAACNSEITAQRTAQVAPALAAYRKAADSNRAALLAKYSAAYSAATLAAQKTASECAANFSVETVPGGELVALITLYNTARDTANSRRATSRLLTDPNLPPRVHGQALQVAISQELVRDPNYFGIIVAAEKLAGEVDALPDSLDDIKLAVHRAMVGRYDYLDVAEGLRSHAVALIALGRKLNAQDAMLTGYSLLARSFADRLHPDSALRILDVGEKEIGAPATEAFKDFRNRYALIGTPAPRITAAWWINPDASAVAAPAPGRVTLIEFTAHWCGPCKNSYPGLRALAQKFGGKPFDGFMVTQLYGYLGTQKNLSPDQEIAADREYFGKEHALPFPVAINPQIKITASRPIVEPQPDTDYRVGGIPQIMLIDKHGVIRQIVTGWDQGNTERFSKLIDQLLAEKP